MLIAIEGIDGSGKGTQASLLARRADEAGLTTAVFTFPGYEDNPFGQAVGQYLNGQFGDVTEVAPQLAALLYAGDRYATKDSLIQSCQTCCLVISDRYVASNLAHQAAKLRREKRAAFIDWINTIEYEIYGLPRASVTFYLDIPVDVSAELVLRKKKRSYTSLAADIHESDTDYLQECKDVYESLIESDEDNEWHRIACTTSSGLRDPNEISDDIWRVVSKHLLAQGAKSLTDSRTGRKSLILDSMNVRIALCGTSCTGKTTLAHALRQHAKVSSVFPTLLPEGARELLDEAGVQLADLSLHERRAFQLRYFEWKQGVESHEGNWIADRAFVDVAAVWVERDARDDIHLQAGLVDRCRELCSNYSYLIHLRHGDVPFEDDGVRLLDIDLHGRIARRISSFLEEWNLPYKTLESLALEERVDEVVRILIDLGFIPRV